MKTVRIELQKIKSMSNRNGLIEARVDALVLPASRGDDEGGNTLAFDEPTARVLLLLLKQQLAEFDGRKARSQR